jgi:putative transcriptional regulator
MEAMPEMPIVVNLDLVLVSRKMTLTELSRRIGISVTNLSLLKTGKVRGIRFATLDAICRELECQPGDLLTRSDAAEGGPDIAERRKKDE